MEIERALPEHNLEPETVIEAGPEEDETGPEEKRFKEDLPFDDPRF